MKCCKHCKDRNPPCWDSCPKYQEEKSQREAYKASQRFGQIIDSVQYHSYTRNHSRKKQMKK